MARRREAAYVVAPEGGKNCLLREGHDFGFRYIEGRRIVVLSDVSARCVGRAPFRERTWLVRLHGRAVRWQLHPDPWQLHSVR
jgi:hypothetical protein